MAPIKRRGQLSHDLHLSADDRRTTRPTNSDTWLQSRCASTDEHLEAIKRSMPARQRAYSLCCPFPAQGPSAHNLLHLSGYK
ncbi:hypothetical protein Hanom_Chr05g00393611 [Helianthus anomalus]